MTPDELLAAYDDDLREDGEFPPTIDHRRHGPLLWVHFPRRGFVTYRDLGGLDGTALDELIGATAAHFRNETAYASVEWKTRGHDRPRDLGARLERQGWAPDEVETVMIGEAAALVADVALPAGVVVRRCGEGGDGADLEDDVRRMLEMQQGVFGPDSGPRVEDVVGVIRDDLEEYWVAEAGERGDRRVVGAGRLSPVPGTPFAGLWGGGIEPRWRGHGIYRALVAARAASAVERGVRLVHSDCTAMSRPILERSGLVAVTTTTPYVLRLAPR